MSDEFEKQYPLCSILVYARSSSRESRLHTYVVDVSAPKQNRTAEQLCMAMSELVVIGMPLL